MSPGEQVFMIVAFWIPLALSCWLSVIWLAYFIYQQFRDSWKCWYCERDNPLGRQP